jgi:hypothetical protein
LTIEQKARGRVAQHKFNVGQLVNYSAKVGVPASSGGYKVVRLLPPEGGHLLYRIKSSGETFERVAREQDLKQRQLT